jgi:hypothetical protein
MIKIMKYNYQPRGYDPVVVKSIQEKVGGIICVNIGLEDTHKYIDIGYGGGCSEIGNFSCLVLSNQDGDEKVSLRLDLIGLEYKDNYEIVCTPLKYEYLIHLIPTEILYNKGKEIEWEKL